MGNVKHTPGPWVALYDERRGNYQISSEAKDGMGHWIANTKCESVPAHHEANAHLIAAAPDLYAALKECEVTLRVMGHDSEPLARMAEAARAALSQADGRDGGV